MPEISIIVPVYQAEKYIERCIKSILAQTFSDFELLLIDDGSMDASSGICDHYATLDKRINVVHQKNAGVSAARNKGIALSSGKYIMFCDSDDYVDPHWCEYLYHAIIQHPHHIITCGYNRVAIDGSSRGNTYGISTEMITSSYFDLWKMGCSAYTWTKIYEKSLITKHSLHFLDNVRFAEDVSFNVDYFKFCYGAVILPYSLYYYTETPGSLMKQPYDDFFPIYSYPFTVRLPLISKCNLGEFCDYFLADFIRMFSYIFERNDISYFAKLKYNQKIAQSEAFQFCVQNASGKYENAVLMKTLKIRNYYLFWLITQLASAKHLLKGLVKKN